MCFALMWPVAVLQTVAVMIPVIVLEAIDTFCCLTWLFDECHEAGAFLPVPMLLLSLSSSRVAKPDRWLRWRVCTEQISKLFRGTDPRRVGAVIDLGLLIGNVEPNPGPSPTDNVAVLANTSGAQCWANAVINLAMRVEHITGTLTAAMAAHRLHTVQDLAAFVFRQMNDMADVGDAFRILDIRAFPYREDTNLIGTELTHLPSVLFLNTVATNPTMMKSTIHMESAPVPGNFRIHQFSSASSTTYHRVGAILHPTLHFVALVKHQGVGWCLHNDAHIVRLPVRADDTPHCPHGVVGSVVIVCYVKAGCDLGLQIALPSSSSVRFTDCPTFAIPSTAVAVAPVAAIPSTAVAPSSSSPAAASTPAPTRATAAAEHGMLRPRALYLRERHNLLTSKQLALSLRLQNTFLFPLRDFKPNRAALQAFYVACQLEKGLESSSGAAIRAALAGVTKGCGFTAALRHLLPNAASMQEITGAIDWSAVCDVAAASATNDAMNAAQQPLVQFTAAEERRLAARARRAKARPAAARRAPLGFAHLGMGADDICVSASFFGRCIEAALNSVGGAVTSGAETIVFAPTNAFPLFRSSINTTTTESITVGGNTFRLVAVLAAPPLKDVVADDDRAEFEAASASSGSEDDEDDGRLAATPADPDLLIRSRATLIRFRLGAKAQLHQYDRREQQARQVLRHVQCVVLQRATPASASVEQHSCSLPQQARTIIREASRGSATTRVPLRGVTLISRAIANFGNYFELLIGRLAAQEHQPMLDLEISERISAIRNSYFAALNGYRSRSDSVILASLATGAGDRLAMMSLQYLARLDAGVGEHAVAEWRRSNNEATAAVQLHVCRQDLLTKVASACQRAANHARDRAARHHYLHVADLLRLVCAVLQVDYAASSSADPSKQECPFHYRGNCHLGRRCWRRHGLQRPRPAQIVGGLSSALLQKAQQAHVDQTPTATTTVASDTTTPAAPTSTGAKRTRQMSNGASVSATTPSTTTVTTSPNSGFERLVVVQFNARGYQPSNHCDLLAMDPDVIMVSESNITDPDSEAWLRFGDFEVHAVPAKKEAVDHGVLLLVRRDVISKLERLPRPSPEAAGAQWVEAVLTTKSGNVVQLSSGYLRPGRNCRTVGANLEAAMFTPPAADMALIGGGDLNVSDNNRRDDVTVFAQHHKCIIGNDPSQPTMRSFKTSPDITILRGVKCINWRSVITRSHSDHRALVFEVELGGKLTVDKKRKEQRHRAVFARSNFTPERFQFAAKQVVDRERIDLSSIRDLGVLHKVLVEIMHEAGRISCGFGSYRPPSVQRVIDDDEELKDLIDTQSRHFARYAAPRPATQQVVLAAAMSSVVARDESPAAASRLSPSANELADICRLQKRVRQKFDEKFNGRGAAVGSARWHLAMSGRAYTVADPVLPDTDATPIVKANTFAEHFRKLCGDSEATAIGAFGPGRVEPLTRVEYQAAVRKLKTRKSSGPDDLIAEFVKALPKELDDALFRLIDQCMQRRVIPNDMGDELGFPLFKGSGGNPNDPQNYRIISSGNAFQKLLDTILNERLARFDARLHHHQYAGRGGTAEHLVTFLVSDIRDAVVRAEKRTFVHAIKYDLCKAYDLAVLPTLQRALRSHLREDAALADLITYTLTSRRLAVQVENRRSVPVMRTRGVPQGSPLSPRLFSIYMNEVVSHINSGAFDIDDVKIRAYAFVDDITVTATGKNTKRLSVALKEVDTYLRTLSQQFTINDAKCREILFRSDVKQKVTMHPVRYADIPHEALRKVREKSVDVIKKHCLRVCGVWLDHSLTFLHHSLIMEAEFRAAVGSMRTNSYRCGQGAKGRRAYYLQYVLPKALFAAAAWWPILNNVKCIEKLNVVHRSAQRIICTMPKHTGDASLDFVSNFLNLDDLATHRAMAFLERLEQATVKEWQDRAYRAPLRPGNGRKNDIKVNMSPIDLLMNTRADLYRRNPDTVRPQAVPTATGVAASRTSRRPLQFADRMVRVFVPRGRDPRRELGSAALQQLSEATLRRAVKRAGHFDCVVYTDGAKWLDRASATTNVRAGFIFDGGPTVVQSLDVAACAYDAEVFAISMALRHLLGTLLVPPLTNTAYGRPASKVLIATDSLSAVKKLKAGPSGARRDALVAEIWELTRALAAMKVQVHFVHVYGHCGIPGNEAIDAALKTDAAAPAAATFNVVTKRIRQLRYLLRKERIATTVAHLHWTGIPFAHPEIMCRISRGQTHVGLFGSILVNRGTEVGELRNICCNPDDRTTLECRTCDLSRDPPKPAVTCIVSDSDSGTDEDDEDSDDSEEGEDEMLQCHFCEKTVKRIREHHKTCRARPHRLCPWCGAFFAVHLDGKSRIVRQDNMKKLVAETRGSGAAAIVAIANSPIAAGFANFLHRLATRVSGSKTTLEENYVAMRKALSRLDKLAVPVEIPADILNAYHTAVNDHLERVSPHPLPECHEINIRPYGPGVRKRVVEVYDVTERGEISPGGSQCDTCARVFPTEDRKNKHGCTWDQGEYIVNGEALPKRNDVAHFSHFFGCPPLRPAGGDVWRPRSALTVCHCGKKVQVNHLADHHPEQPLHSVCSPAAMRLVNQAALLAPDDPFNVETLYHIAFLCTCSALLPVQAQLRDALGLNEASTSDEQKVALWIAVLDHERAIEDFIGDYLLVLRTAGRSGHSTMRTRRLMKAAEARATAAGASGVATPYKVTWWTKRRHR